MTTLADPARTTMTLSSRYYRRIRIALFILCAVSLGLTILLTARYLNRRAELQQAAFTAAQQQASTAASDIDRAFSGVMTITSNLADDLSAGRLAYADIDARLHTEVSHRPDLDGIAITFQPYVYDPNQRLYQEYIFQKPDGTLDTLKGATYDYTVLPSDVPGTPKTAWYHGPLVNGAMWNEPFLATGAGKVLIEYGVPFFQTEGPTQKKSPAGVVTIDYSLQDMNTLVAKLDLGATGYGYVISHQGTLLAYPVQDMVGRSTIFDLAKQLGDDRISDSAQRALNGETSSLDSQDQVTGQTSWMFFEPIPDTTWALGLVLNRADFALDAQETLQQQVAIAVAATAFLFFLSLLALRVGRSVGFSVWAASFMFAVLLTGLIAVTWILAYGAKASTGVDIADQTTLNRYLQSYTQNLGPTAPQIITVPTGISVQSIQFGNALSVIVNGVIWQRYPKSLGDDVPRGFALPQQTDTQDIVEEISRQDQGTDELILWRFGVTLTQNFDPTRFPFDSREISIRLAPKAIGKNIVLVPDLSAYSLLSPSSLPGLDQKISLNGWSLHSSGFGYQSVTYNTNFGLQNAGGLVTVPELHFNIEAQRAFLGPFIVYLLPAVVVAFMLFAFLISDRKPGDEEEIVNTLTYTASLFFVIAIVHASLRDNTAAVGLTYLEYFYILLYVAITAIAINSFLVVRVPQFRLFRYHGNLIPRAMFWPLIVGAMFLSTLFIFVAGH